MPDYVVVLHGIFRTEKSMLLLVKYLQKQEFEVINIGYPSIRKSLSEIADLVHERVMKDATDKNRKIHFVGFSMGGLVIRAYLKKYRPHNLGRVVMIGTPNHGSELADVARNWKWYRLVFGPAGQQLITTQDDFAHELESNGGAVDYELGIIAGNLCLSPLSACIIRKPSDGRVSVESTRLDGMKEHAVIRSPHEFMHMMPKAMKMTASFLKTGKF